MQGLRRRGDWDDVAVAARELEEQKHVFAAAVADPPPLPAGPAAWRCIETFYSGPFADGAASGRHGL
jgi:hypothetical protein